MRHTGEKWISSQFNQGGAEITDDVGHSIALVGNVFGTYEENEANARLIAAAPALLEACKQLMRLQHIQFVGNSEGQEINRNIILSKARAAIKAAGGE